MKKLKELTGFDLENIWEVDRKRREDEENAKAKAKKPLVDTISCADSSYYGDIAVRYFTSGAYKSVFFFGCMSGLGGTMVIDEAGVAVAEGGLQLLYI